MTPYRSATAQRQSFALQEDLYAMKFSIATSALLATSASAHTIFTQLHVNGVAQGHLKGVRVPVRRLTPFRVCLTSYLHHERHMTGMHAAFPSHDNMSVDIDMQQAHQ